MLGGAGGADAELDGGVFDFGFYGEVDEDGAFGGEDVVDAVGEVFQVVVGEDGGVAGAFGDFFPVGDAVGAGDGLAAGDGIDAVVEEEVVEVFGLLGGGGDEGAEVHQQAAVAVEDEDFAVGAGEGDAEADVAGFAHSAGDGQVKVLVGGYGGQAEADIAGVHRGDDNGVFALAVNDADGVGVGNHWGVLLGRARLVEWQWGGRYDGAGQEPNSVPMRTATGRLRRWDSA